MDINARNNSANIIFAKIIGNNMTHKAIDNA